MNPALYLLPPLFFLTALVTVVLLGRAGGWAALARHYGGRAVIGAHRRHVASGYVGWVRYNNCLTAAATPGGLAIVPYLPFRLGHPPLFIPWADVTVRPVAGVLRQYLEFRFAGAPGVAVSLAEPLGRRLLADAGRG